MGQQKLRRITVGDMHYLWKLNTIYQPSTYPPDTGGAVGYICHDRFTAFLAGSPSSPLRVQFITRESPVVGGPLHYGGALVPGGTPSGIHLHTPRWAAIILRLAMEQGWQPALPKQPLVIENGLQWLAAAGLVPDGDRGRPGQAH